MWSVYHQLGRPGWNHYSHEGHLHWRHHRQGVCPQFLQGRTEHTAQALDVEGKDLLCIAPILTQQTKYQVTYQSASKADSQ
jgi:hypothetical protein